MKGSVWQLTRHLLRSVPKGERRFWLSAFLAACADAASVALMAVSAWLLSRAAEMPPVLYLQVAAVGVRFFAISRSVFRYTERLSGHDLALRMQGALRLETYQRLARTTLLGRKRGDLLVRIVADVEAIQDVVVRVAVPILSASVVILGTTIMLGRFSPASAAVLLVSAILAGAVVPFWASRASRAADLAAAPLRGKLGDQIRELSTGSLDLVAFGADRAGLDRMSETDEQLRQVEERAAWVRGVAIAAQIMAAGIAVVAALWIGGEAVAAGTLHPRLLAVLVLTPLALHEVLGTFAQGAQTLTKAQAALGRVQEILDQPPLGVGDRPDEQVDATEARVSFTDLQIGWPSGEPVTGGLSGTVRGGERLAVVGRSGIGKTTLAATLMGLIPPLSGTCQVTGRVGYLAQDAYVFATSVAENVRVGNKDASREEIREALDRAGLQHLDADRMVGEQGTTLSGGEARRLALARLLVAEHDVIILDEPTEHLDRDTADKLMADLWHQFPNTPALVISHDAKVINQCGKKLEL